MTDQIKREETATRANHRQGAAAGGAIAASIILLTVGILSIFQGISAIAKDDLLVVGYNYTYEFDVTTWGWVHLVVGVLLLLAGIGLFSGATWARFVAIVVASLSIIANFLWLPYYPLWSILIIAIDLVVIWAVATWDPTRIQAP
ncbi:DUF7144 family membrane protein [Rhodococcoides kyotonense]|uniref:DUF7144 domain-containing protein n=1 Tax=Rhodococcoides kyotonense TaxID=398843 RepID=A0A239LXA4_9NOCA|nr:hypothetical protein [Rhodococcus kyotonensis]SNT34433.1 hypothetical protein SAMN05421642_114149 [Rhodococcus kyotonensis]